MTQKEEFSKEELQKAKELAKDYAPAIENMDAKNVLYDAILEMSQWKEKQMIEKTINWLDSIMYYVSKEDKRLVCNFTNFDEFIHDFEQTMEE